MRFWDSSAIVPLLVDQPSTARMIEAARSDDVMVVWWGSVVECASAIARGERDGVLTGPDADTAYASLARVATAWHEVTPSEECRERSVLLLRRHPLRAADALQLAAALVWSRGRPKGHTMCTLDARLASAARTEGFALAFEA